MKRVLTFCINYLVSISVDLQLIIVEMTMTSERVPLFPQEKVQDEPTLLKEKVSMGEQELRKLMEDKELTPELKESFFR